MCGIMGYVGPRNAQTVLIDGLGRLEYRGYDSAGLATVDQAGSVHTVKAVGKLENLREELKRTPLDGHYGIGHTRWATHGGATQANAHPHASPDGRVTIVHNGIIENYQALKQRYLSRAKLLSETDTEVAAGVLGAKLATAKSLHDGLRMAMKEFEGAYAFCAVSPAYPGELVVARAGSPLIIGVGKGENFVASDVPAILPYTNRVIYLDEGESARITAEGVQVFDAAGKAKTVKPKTVNLSIESAEKGGFEHFMLKEIHEQPEAIRKTLQGRIKAGQANLDELQIPASVLKRIKRIVLIACGTSHHAALVAKYALQEMAAIPVDVEIASEYRYAEPPVDQSVLAIVISQSGETTDTRFAAELAQKHGAFVLAICNVVSSSIPRMADATLYTRAGIEIGVASTKAYTTQLAALLLFSAWLGRKRKVLSPAKEKAFIKELASIPKLLEQVLAGKLVGVKRCAERYQNVNNFMYIGRRYNYATAFEGALKLKEISYIHAEGYGAGEMKHGPIALVEGSFPTIVICPHSPIYEKTISNIREIVSRKGVIVAIASEGDTRIRELAEYLIYIPKTSEALSPILAVAPLQLLAYYTAVKRGCDPDKPRNLAKAVTVE